MDQELVTSMRYASTRSDLTDASVTLASLEVEKLEAVSLPSTVQAGFARSMANAWPMAEKRATGASACSSA